MLSGFHRVFKTIYRIYNYVDTYFMILWTILCVLLANVWSRSYWIHCVSGSLCVCAAAIASKLHSCTDPLVDRMTQPLPVYVQQAAAAKCLG